MTREKRKWKYDELEEHVTAWAIDRLDSMRDVVQTIHNDRSIKEDKKDLLFNTLAKQTYHLIGLIEPLEHDQQNLIEWAQHFVDEHAVFDKD